MKKIQSAISRYSAQIRASLNDPLMWRRIVACIMLGMAWSFQRAPDAGVAGFIGDHVSEATYLLVACGVFILARPESAFYQLCTLPLTVYVAFTWTFLKTKPPEQQAWSAFFLYFFAAAIAFWLPVHWPKEGNDGAKPLA